MSLWVKEKLHLMKGSLVQLPLCHTRRHRTGHLSLHFHMTSMMMPRAPPATVALVLRTNQWQTAATGLRLNRKTRASCLLHVYDTDRTRHHPTSRSSGHQVPDLCLIILDPPHQVSYSCLDPCRCLPCRIHHLHITRQANTFLHTE
jgi:hypothetical protein